jgi:hypothetical protein
MPASWQCRRSAETWLVVRGCRTAGQAGALHFLVQSLV